MTAAIICEYNPFHNGHKYLIDETRRILGEDTRIIAVMSGNFVQRGEPSAFDKWSRTKAALLCGIDAVAEIPSVFAASSAQYFAEAAVSIVNKLGCADYLVFGSETGDTEFLFSAAKARAYPTEEFQISLKSALKEGLSYPAAMQKVLGCEELLSNDILGVEYVRALLLLNSKVKPLAVKRGGSAPHHSDTVMTDTSIASAQALRNALLNASCSEDVTPNCKLVEYIPSEALSVQFAALDDQNGKINVLDNFEQYIFAQIRILKSEGLRKLPFVTEGLENKIYAECCRSNSLSELIENCTGSRYTRTRITRILISLITGARSSHFGSKPIDIPYVRVLGIKKEAQSLLSEISEACERSGTDFIAGNIPAGLKGLSEKSARLLEAEATATDLYVLAHPEKKADCEYSKPLIIV